METPTTTPQLEDGFTRIANELLEAFARIRIPGEARQILDVIIRKTYGFRKKEDRISSSQLSEATGLKKQHITRGVGKLVELNLISVTQNGYSFPATYRINKDSATWRPYPKKVTGENAENAEAVTQYGYDSNPKRLQAVTQKGSSCNPIGVPQKKLSKERERKKETTTTTVKMTVREVSELYLRYAGQNIVGGGMIVVLQDIIRDFTRETIEEAFSAAAAQGIQTRFFLSWCKSRMERRPAENQNQAAGDRFAWLDNEE